MAITSPDIERMQGYYRRFGGVINDLNKENPIRKKKITVFDLMRVAKRFSNYKER